MVATIFVSQKNFALAIVEGPHLRLCIQNVANSGEPGTKCASQLIWTVLVEALGHQPFTRHKLLKFSRTANVVTGLVLQGRALIAVMRSVMQDIKTSMSSYDVSFNETRTKSICKHLVFCEMLQGAAEALYRRYFSVTRLVRR